MFNVGDKVLVKVAVRGGKPVEQRACTVVEVVPANRVPKKKGFYSTKKYDHVNYIVQDAAGERYRPVVSRISLAAGSFGTPVVLPPSVGPSKPEPTLVVPPVPTIAVPPVPVTEYIFCLDASGSMRQFGLEEPTRLAFNAQIEALKASAVGKVSVTVYTFGADVRVLRERQSIEHFAPLTRFDAVESRTRLFDGIDRAMSEASRDPSASFVLQVLTDGYENASVVNAVSLRQRLEDTLRTDRWTHAIMLPRGERDSFLARFPAIPAGNVVEWDTTPKGAKEVGEKAVAATTNYMASRSVGVTRSSNYFQPNLSAVTESDLAKCLDLSQHFKRYEALKETTCREIAEEKSKAPYVIGSAFYQLTKREELQGYKQVLLRHRLSGRIFGGAEARKLIGLQLNVDALVEPGNHGDFEIYFESTSFNRILPRGAHMLHDFKMAVPKQPTWDHAGAFAAAEAKKNGASPRT